MVFILRNPNCLEYYARVYTDKHITNLLFIYLFIRHVCF